MAQDPHPAIHLDHLPPRYRAHRPVRRGHRRRLRPRTGQGGRSRPRHRGGQYLRPDRGGGAGGAGRYRRVLLGPDPLLPGRRPPPRAPAGRQGPRHRRVVLPHRGRRHAPDLGDLRPDDGRPRAAAHRHALPGLLLGGRPVLRRLRAHGDGAGPPPAIYGRGGHRRHDAPVRHRHPPPAHEPPVGLGRHPPGPGARHRRAGRSGPLRPSSDVGLPRHRGLPRAVAGRPRLRRMVPPPRDRGLDRLHQARRRSTVAAADRRGARAPGSPDHPADDARYAQPPGVVGAPGPRASAGRTGRRDTMAPWTTQTPPPRAGTEQWR